MVDKAVGALPRPPLCSVHLQTNAATVGVGLTVPNYLLGAKTWAERAALGAAGGGAGVVPPYNS